MLAWITLYKFNAGVIFPVAHRLLEEGSVFACGKGKSTLVIQW